MIKTQIVMLQIKKYYVYIKYKHLFAEVCTTSHRLFFFAITCLRSPSNL